MLRLKKSPKRIIQLNQKIVNEVVNEEEATRKPITPPAIPAEHTEARRQEIRQRGLEDLYYFTKGILGYNFLVPHVHGHLTQFLDSCEARRRMLLMARGHLKTTIFTISQTMQDIAKDPNVRILIIGSTATNAQKFLKEISEHFKRNEMFRWLYPELIPNSFTAIDTNWTAHEIQVPRTIINRDPTVDTVGARGTVESRHYNIIRADDMIGEAELHSEGEMEKTIEWSQGFESLLVTPMEDLIDITGTHWRFGDVYSFLQDFYSNKEEARSIGPYATMRGELALFIRGARDDKGDPIFPEMISRQFLDRLQRENPPRYASQYANDPLQSGETAFNVEDLQYYERTGPNGRIIKFTHDDVKYRVKISTLDIIAVNDPALGDVKNCDTAQLVVAKHAETDCVFVLEATIGDIDPSETVDNMFRQDEEYHLRLCSVEAVAYQKALKSLSRRIARNENKPYLPIVEYYPGSQRTKDERIRGLMPLVQSHLLYILPSMSKLIKEFTRYTRDGKSKRDGLDALAQISEHFISSWSKQHEVDTREAWEEQISRLNATGYGYKRRFSK